MKIKLLLKDRRPLYVKPCPYCGHALEIENMDIIMGFVYCTCLNKNGKLNKIELEEE